MHRALLALAVLAGTGSACTTFAFQRPQDSAGDAASDATTDSATTDGPDGGPFPSLLSSDDAARLCSQIFRCPQLAEAIELSLALPINTPASPLGFSACMDWLAGPIDPNRPGLAEQQKILRAVAPTSSCLAASAALPVQPSQATTCTSGCAGPDAVNVCPTGGAAFTAACATPYYGQAGACVASDAGLAACVSSGACSQGLSCIDTNTLRDCHPPDDTTFTSYDCALSGRQCASGSGHVAACVIPGKLAPPCLAKQLNDTCDGDSVLHCAGDLLAQTEIACGAVGRTCTTQNAAGAARCTGAADACNPFDQGQNQCTGTTISVCIAGQKIGFDCASIGAGCQGADSTHTAHCG
jgi:hypothetical protein